MSKKTLIFIFSTIVTIFLFFGCQARFSQEKIENLVQEDHKIVQTGHITMTYQDQVNKFKFKYQQFASEHYEMSIYPLLSRPIVLIYKDQGFFLDMQGVVYRNQDALDYLQTLAPNFPWHQLPSIVEHGELASKEWMIDDWNESGFFIAGTEGSVRWKIKNTKQ
jgi:hypothetical protein